MRTYPEMIFRLIGQLETSNKIGKCRLCGGSSVPPYDHTEDCLVGKALEEARKIAAEMTDTPAVPWPPGTVIYSGTTP